MATVDLYGRLHEYDQVRDCQADTPLHLRERTALGPRDQDPLRQLAPQDLVLDLPVTDLPGDLLAGRGDHKIWERMHNPDTRLRRFLFNLRFYLSILTFACR